MIDKVAHSRILSPLLFSITLAWNVLLGRWLRIRNWWDVIDNHIVLGALPFQRDVAGLKKLGVTGVVNTCREYAGPCQTYLDLGMEQFHMPTVDFTHPRMDDISDAVEFIEKHVKNGGKVYIHCKAGRARSATVAMCWMIKSKQIPAAEVQKLLAAKRPHINPHLYQRPVVQEFEKRFLGSTS
jgi:atypical dual specificity phosphatase